jgi:hypothetical protein
MAGLYGRFETKSRSGGDWLTFYLYEEGWTLSWRKYSSAIFVREGGFSDAGDSVARIPVDSSLWSEEVFHKVIESWYDTRSDEYRNGAGKA